MSNLDAKFIEQLGQLSEQIELYAKTFNTQKTRTKTQQQFGLQALSVLKYIKPIIKRTLAIPLDDDGLQEEDSGDCKIKSITLVKPVLGSLRDGYGMIDGYSVVFEKYTVVVDLVLEYPCDLDGTTVKVTFSDGTVKNPKLIINTVNGNNVNASFELDFGGIKEVKNQSKNAKFSILGKSNYESIFYSENKDLDNLDTPEKVQSEINYYTKYSGLVGVYKNGKDFLEKEFSLSLEQKSNGLFYVSVSDLEAAVATHPLLTSTELEADFSKFSIKDLETRKSKYRYCEKYLKDVRLEAAENNGILTDLKDHYTGKNADQIFGAAYNKQIAATKKLLDNLEEKEKAVTIAIGVITEELFRQSIPEKLRKEAEQLEALEVTYDKELAAMKHDVWGYPNAIFTFTEWQDEIKGKIERCPAIQADWDKKWLAFDQAVQTYETNSGKSNTYYRQWKNKHHKPLTDVSAEIKADINEILVVVNPKKAILGKTGVGYGDGRLELGSKENVFSKAEKAKFKQSGAKLKFKELDGPLFEDDASPDDVDQNSVGDCYLLSALASLAQGPSSALLRSMVVEESNQYIVTFYEDGIPIEVAVDKKVMVKEFKTSSNFSNAGGISGTTNTLTYYIGASPKKDVWVPIIEKAYAKFVTQIRKNGTGLDGDYTNIIGGDAASVLKDLLGNRVSAPKRLYLDDNNELTDVKTTKEYKNPIKLPMNVGELEALIKSAVANNYEITVGSPEKFNNTNLTDQHLLDIGEGNYMNFNHAYMISGEESGKVQLFNPHGKTTNRRQIFNKKAKETLTTIAKLKKEILTNSPFISVELKTKMDNAITTLEGYGDTYTRIPNRWKALDNDKKPRMVLNNNRWECTSKGVKLLNKFGKTVDQVLKTDKGKGFVTKELTIEGTQQVSYANLSDNFESVTISIIR